MNYNYPHYHPATTDLNRFSGPAPGETMVDGPFHYLDGSPGCLSDFAGKAIVLETGCRTCPMFNGDVPTMNELARRYPDVVFLALYVREAHPGNRISHHRSLGQKLALAREQAKAESDRHMIVDTLDGTLHRAYGTLPNSVHVINAQGTVVYRSDWSHPGAVADLLDRLESQQPILLDHYEKPPPAGLIAAVKILSRGGWQALADILANLPGLIWAHWRARQAFGAARIFTTRRWAEALKSSRKPQGSAASQPVN